MITLRVLVGVAVAAPLLALGVPAEGAKTHTVVIEGMQFAPPSLTVQRGDAVVWINRDLVPHTATAAGEFDSRSIAAGKTWRMVAKAPGSYAYVCTLHPGMKAMLVIE